MTHPDSHAFPRYFPLFSFFFAQNKDVTSFVDRNGRVRLRFKATAAVNTNGGPLNVYMGVKYTLIHTYQGDGSKPVVDKGASSCTSSYPCMVCEGDCDRDCDCAYGLACFQRTYSSQTVPGCATTGYVKCVE